MNLWVNRLKQLTILSVALFFYSCKDEINLLGIKNPNSKFDVKYIEIPIESSVLLFDSIRTSNYFFQKEVNRLLVGKTDDAIFGDVTAKTCTQFYSPSSAKLAATATFDYATIDLTFDNYTYGLSKSATPQKISIYELGQVLSDSSIAKYKNKTPIPTSGFITDKSFTLDPAILQSYNDKNKDTTLTLTIDPLVSNFGQRLFQSALNYRDDLDTTFAYYTLLTKKFPGIVVIPNECDKVFGFNPTNTKSRISLHYHLTTDTIKRVLNLVFASAVSFNNISSDKGGTVLELLTEANQDFNPPDNNRYIQSGTGIFTKLDIENFLKFSDTIPNMILNSAELVIGNVEDGGEFAPPAALALRVLKNDNMEYHFGTKNSQSVSDLAFYKGAISPDISCQTCSILIDNDSVFSAATDGNRQLVYSKTEKKYVGHLSQFLQQVYTKAEGKTQLRYFVLYPISPVAAKSVNRVRFPKDNIKLRIYYTLPTVND